MKAILDYFKNILNQALLHLLFWLLMYLLLIQFFGFKAENMEYIYRFCGYILPITTISSYYFAYYLIPKFLFTKKYKFFLFYSLNAFIISLYFYILAIYFSLIVLYELQMNAMPPISKSLFFVVFSGFSIIILFCLIRLYSYQNKVGKKNQELENKIINTKLYFKEQELQYLKSQIHPHFLFNTLNTIYGLALKNSDITPTVVLKLSGLLDYLLYQTNKKIVSLEDEINHILDYISLEEVRFKNNLKIKLNYPDEIPNIKIAPMLLSPFIENAFKHGRNINNQLEITSSIIFEKEILKFEIINNYIPSIKTKNTGIGLENLKNRLKILYPESHELIIEENLDKYHVRLFITNPEQPKSYE